MDGVNFTKEVQSDSFWDVKFIEQTAENQLDFFFSRWGARALTRPPIDPGIDSY
jgi:hypothetical protein